MALLGLFTIAYAELPGLSECRERVRSADEAGWGCFYELARQTGGYAEITEVVEGLSGEDPDDPRKLLTLGSLYTDQGRPEAIARFAAAAEGFAH